MARAAIAALALADGDLTAFGRAIEGSIFEQRRATLVPGGVRVLEAARKAGALGATISGAGPAIAAVSDSSGDLGGIADAMKKEFAAAGVSSETFIASAAAGAVIEEST